MGFSLSGAMAGAGGAAADIGGQIIKDQSQFDVQSRLEELRAKITAERDARLSEQRMKEYKTNKGVDVESALDLQKRGIPIEVQKTTEVGAATNAVKAGEPFTHEGARVIPGADPANPTRIIADPEMRDAKIDQTKSQAGLAKDHGKYYRDLPGREDRQRADGERRDARATAQTLVNSGHNLLRDAKDAEKMFNEKWMGRSRETLKGAELAAYDAELDNISELRKTANESIRRGNELLSNGGRGTGNNPAPTAKPTPNQDAINFLNEDPEWRRDQFEQLFGVSADKFIGKNGGAGSTTATKSPQKKVEDAPGILSSRVSPDVDDEQGFSAITPWSVIERGLMSRNPRAIEYTRKRLSSRPMFGVEPPESVRKLMEQIEAESKRDN